MRIERAHVLTLVALAIVASSVVVGAQSASGIAGTVTDSSGAALPGVTVEASSPALIEKTRSATTDESGRYSITNLQPGTYLITFSLPGFNVHKRDGIALTTNFTAQVNAELSVGTLEETVTVTGSSPVVDVQSAHVQQQLTRETLDAIPTGRSAWAIGSILPGITSSGVDVGGSAGFQSLTLFVHGSKGDNVYQINGMTVQSGIGNGTAAQYYNDGMFEEYTYTTSAIPAEVAYGGVRIQMTGKEGSNAFRGTGLLQMAPWQSDNFSDELRDAGLRNADRTLRLYDASLSLGGPVLRDRLWFFATHRYNGGETLVGNSFYKDRSLCTDVDWGTSDIERKYDCQGVDDNTIRSTVGQVTFQATPRNKISAYYAKENKYRGHRELLAGVSPEASAPQVMPLSYSAQLKWVAPITDRLLWDAGVSQYYLDYTLDYQPVAGDVSKTDLVLQETWGARPEGFFRRSNYKRYWSGTLSYVTGSHSFKTGLQYNQAEENSQYDVRRGHVVQQYRNGVPSSVLADNTPVFNRPRHEELGLFVQDSWRLERLTVNPGIRFDWFHASLAQQAAGAGRWVPERQYDEIDDIPRFKNWSPRLSVVYDLFGNARTAVKASVGQYVRILGNGQADLYNPLFVDTDQRTWSDLNSNDIAEDNEIGPSTRTGFGIRPPRRPDAELVRERNWEYAVSVQHEVSTGLSVQFGYFRRVFLDLPFADNLLVGPDDYSPLQVADPRGNGELITVYSLNRDKFGLVDNLDTNSATNREYWNGVEASMQGRLGSDGRVYGGVTLGGSSVDSCEVDDPNQLRFCDRSEPWLPQWKLGGSYMLPWSTQVSGSFSSFPGSPLPVTYVVNRALLPTLTQTSVTVRLDDPLDSDRRFERRNIVDIRFAKLLDLGRNRLFKAQFDIFNAFNSNSVLAAVTSFGPTVYQPRTIVQGRLHQFGLQFNF